MYVSHNVISPSETGLYNNTQSVSGNVQRPPTTHNKQNSSASEEMGEKSETGKYATDTCALHSGRLRSRGRRNYQQQSASDATTATSGEEGADRDEDGTRSSDVRYHLRRPRGRGRRGLARESDETSDKVIERRSTRANKWTMSSKEKEESDREEEDSDHSEKERTDVPLDQSAKALSPSALTGVTDSSVSVYATPPRLSVSLAPKKQWKRRLSNLPEEQLKQGLGQLHQQREIRDLQTKRVEVRVVDVGAVGPLKGRYPLSNIHLLSRVAGGANKSDSTETQGTGTAMVTRAAAMRQKRKRMSSSPELSESSNSSVSEQRSTGSRAMAANRSPKQSARRPKRHVLFYESDDSSLEKSNSAKQPDAQQTNLQGKSAKIRLEQCSSGRQGESSSDLGKASLRSRRKPGTPRKFGQKLKTEVHFSQSDGDDTLCDNPSKTLSGSKTRASPVSHAGRLRSTAVSKGSSRPNEGKQEDGNSSNTHSRHVVTHSSDSSSECEADVRNTHRTRTRKSHTRHLRQPSYSRNAVTSGHRVVDLADNYTELSQPSSQWDYVAVQTVAANYTRGKDRTTRIPETGSDHEHGSDEIAVAMMSRRSRCSGGGGDKLSIVSESSTGSTSPMMRPAFLYNLRKQDL